MVQGHCLVDSQKGEESPFGERATCIGEDRRPRSA
jgi:hypothetical protein